MHNRNTSKERARASVITYLISTAAIFVILFIGLGISKCSFNAKKEMEFSPQLEDGYPAYIQITSIEPKFSVTRNYGGYVSNVVCHCTTTSGESVWLYISTSDYSKYIDSNASFGSTLLDNEFETKYFSEKIIIHGKVRDAEDLCDGLEKKTAKTVLLFLSLEE